MIRLIYWLKFGLACLVLALLFTLLLVPMDKATASGSSTFIFYENAVSADGKNTFKKQADKRKEYYKKRYPGTKVSLVEVRNAKEFKQKWNAMSGKIDAVEIILHGSIDISLPWQKGVGYLYFGVKTGPRIAAGKGAVNNSSTDILISDLLPKSMDFLYFSSCNSGNLDSINVARVFNNIVYANEVVGWDGGVIFNFQTEQDERGGGDHIYAPRYQSTWFFNGGWKRWGEGHQGKVWIKDRAYEFVPSA